MGTLCCWVPHSNPPLVRVGCSPKKQKAQPLGRAFYYFYIYCGRSGRVIVTRFRTLFCAPNEQLRRKASAQGY